MKLAVINIQWLDQQIEKYTPLLKAAHDDNDYDWYNSLSAEQSAFKAVKAQLSPLKEHIESAFKAGADNWDERVKVIRGKGIVCHTFVNPNLDDYLKQQGYE